LLKSTIAGAEDDRISLHDYISTVVDYGPILLNTHNEDKAEKKAGELLKSAPTESRSEVSTWCHAASSQAMF
jgi:hypothetical protein